VHTNPFIRYGANVFIGSLFDRQFSEVSDSTPANKNDFDDDLSTGASPSKKVPSLTGDSLNLNGKNPKLEKLRNKMKGDLFKRICE